MRSMMDMAHLSKTKVTRLLTVWSGPNIATPRNKIVKQFLEDGDEPWLLMIDTDMVFRPNMLDRLVDAADWKDKPIMGALCYSQLTTEDTIGIPTCYDLIELEDGKPTFLRLVDGPREREFNQARIDGKPIKVSATGTGCLLMHRDSLVNIVARNKAHERAFPWFQETVMGGHPCGEDMTFCLRAGAAGIPIHVHTGVQVGHMKSTMLGAAES